MKNKKNILILCLLLGSSLLSACQRSGTNNTDITLGEIKKIESNSETENPSAPSREDGTDIKVITDKSNEDMVHGGGWLINDNDSVKNLTFQAQGEVTGFVSARTMLLYKTKDNAVFLYDAKNGGHKIISSSETLFTPYKIGASGSVILSIDFNMNDYKVINSNGSFEIRNAGRDMIMSDLRYAYMFKGGVFERYTLDSKTYEKVELIVDGKPAEIKAMYDRFDSGLIEAFIGDTIYLINPDDISEGKVVLTENDTINANDVKKVLKDSQTNGANSFVYLSTDGNLKVYNKYLKKVSHVFTDVITKRLPNNPRAFVIAGAGGAEMIYFTDFHSAYRYEPNTEFVYEVNIKPLTRLQSLESDIVKLNESNGTIVYPAVLSILP